MNNLFLFDKKYLEKYSFVIGTDEAGRGPGAGSVFAAAVCFPSFNASLLNNLLKLNDSKKLSHSTRETLFDIITKNTIWSINEGTVQDIENFNILQTSLLTMKKSVENVQSKLKNKNVITLVDGNKKIPDLEIEQEPIIKGDSKSAAIAAASIVAKVIRDRYMIELDKEFPMYNWAKNKGYLTKEHINAVDMFGLTKWHRKKFFEKHFSNLNNKKGTI